MDDGARTDAAMDAGMGRRMSWYTTDHARRDAARQAARQGSLDKAKSSKQVTGYECAHCRAAYGHADTTTQC